MMTPFAFNDVCVCAQIKSETDTDSLDGTECGHVPAGEEDESPKSYKKVLTEMVDEWVRDLSAWEAAKKDPSGVARAEERDRQRCDEVTLLAMSSASRRKGSTLTSDTHVDDSDDDAMRNDDDESAVDLTARLATNTPRHRRPRDDDDDDDDESGSSVSRGV